MSIKIHHGPPGSYKTSGAVMDDFIKAVLLGRLVVTNVRGLNDRQRVIDTVSKIRCFPKFWLYHSVPETFDIIWIDTEVLHGRYKLASFFHWAPHGAFLLIDEAQTVWPLAWKDADLKRLDYPGGYDAAVVDNRPQNFLIAFEKHRHFGWDMVLTTPSIDKIRRDIRGCSEGAYKHKNQALNGFKGSYLEAFHLAEDSGKSAGDFLSVRSRKIKSHVWKLYASTATGTHSDTIAGTPIWKNPKIILFLVFFAGLGTFLSMRPAPSVITGKSNSQAVQVAGSKASTPIPGSAGGHVDSFPASTPLSVDVSPFANYKWRLSGVVVRQVKLNNVNPFNFYFLIKNDQEEVFINSSGIVGYGYTITIIDMCHVVLSYKGQKAFSVYCKKEKQIDNSMIQAAK